jgi:hypothetical protein
MQVHCMHVPGDTLALYQCAPAVLTSRPRGVPGAESGSVAACTGAANGLPCILLPTLAVAQYDVAMV